jgi:tRNA A-37 threonylcarbamoyl transferase component Bud32/tetratricopeptide (TPR) repeat protein
MSDFVARLQAAVGDRYRIERELHGGMSRLFLAEERSLERKVVIKVLRPELATEVSAARFQREIQVAARLQHPHILPVLTAGEVRAPTLGGDALLYYVMPYVEGDSVRDRLEREGRLPVADAVQVLTEIADALAFAHAQGVVHRDIKPENILWFHGHAVLTDFGVAQALTQAHATDARLTYTGLAVGTPGYMAPEQALGSGTVDGRADLYGLAVVGYEMLAGGPPFDGDSAQAMVAAHIVRTPRPLSEVRAEVPPNVSAAIARAMAKEPTARVQTAEEFRQLLTTEHVAPRRRRRLWLIGAAGATALLAVLAGTVGRRSAPRSTLDTNLVAIAPFDVLDQGLDLWREGLVDVLSRDLDGIGPLRTVPPTTVVRRWRGQADTVAATRLGRATGAGLTVFGELLAAGPDSVRLLATLLDVEHQRVLGEFRLQDASNRMDQLSDSLSAAVLRDLGQTRSVTASRVAALGTRSRPALRAFLHGEQMRRQANWDSAVAYYGQAVAEDSSFALAWSRLGGALGWQRSGEGDFASAEHLRAATLNRGLSPRDSLLLVTDSLSAALFSETQDRLWYHHARRLFATAELATKRYPQDPAAWYALGEARYHFGYVPGVGVGLRAALAAFDRAIALDSAFAPAYIHPIDMALTLDGPTAARRYIKPYLALNPTDGNAEAIRALASLLNTTAADEDHLRGMVDTLPADVIRRLIVEGLERWPDAAERATRLYLAAEQRFGDSLGLPDILPAHLLAYRGHLREAFSLYGTDAPIVVLWSGLLGILPADTVDVIFRQYRRQHNPAEQYAAAWWAARRDTLELRRQLQDLDSLAADSASTDVRSISRYGADAARAYLSLARGDSATALAQFKAVPDSLCPWCTVVPLTRVRLAMAARQDQEAHALLERQLFAPFQVTNVLWAYERGRVGERVGDRIMATDGYRFVARVWQNADPRLHGYVIEAKAGLRRLTH